MKKRFFTLFALVFSAALLFAACGSGAEFGDSFAEALAVYEENDFDAEVLVQLTPMEIVEIAAELSATETSSVIATQIFVLMDLMGLTMGTVELDIITAVIADDGEVAAFAMEMFLSMDMLGMEEQEFITLYYYDGVAYSYIDGVEEILETEFDVFKEEFDEMLQEFGMGSIGLDFTELEEITELVDFYVTDDGIIMEFVLDGTAFGAMDGLIGDFMDGFMGEMIGMEEGLSFGDVMLTVGIDYDGYLRSVTIETVISVEMEELPGFAIGVGVSFTQLYAALGDEVEIELPDDLLEYQLVDSF
ncbi:MAG: hypothetical protein FWE91_03800 [Defluviitaleaceae bacterium]|nr:hypothetical protein [Defluviitaleaceae bacterium]MCL2835973.1 hypothetical protein [Defluviitaleaceae bacterium]